MLAANLKRALILISITAIFTANAYAEVEIYKGGKRYIPGQEMEQAPASKDDKALTPPLKDNETPTPATKSGLDPMKILENLSDYLTKEQIEQIRKNMPTLQLEGMGNIEKSNSEIPLGNYTN